MAGNQATDVAGDYYRSRNNLLGRFQPQKCLRNWAGKDSPTFLLAKVFR